MVSHFGTCGDALFCILSPHWKFPERKLRGELLPMRDQPLEDKLTR